MSFIFSPPKPQPLPAAEPPPSRDDPDSQEVADAAAAERRRRQQAAGRASTILTGGVGVQGDLAGGGLGRKVLTGA